MSISSIVIAGAAFVFSIHTRMQQKKLENRQIHEIDSAKLSCSLSLSEMGITAYLSIKNNGVHSAHDITLEGGDGDIADGILKPEFDMAIKELPPSHEVKINILIMRHKAQPYNIDLSWRDGCKEKQKHNYFL